MIENSRPLADEDAGSALRSRRSIRLPANKLRRVLIRDQADRNEIAMQLLRYPGRRR